MGGPRRLLARDSTPACKGKEGMDAFRLENKWNRYFMSRQFGPDLTSTTTGTFSS
jgi:hypothetical protein